MTLSRIARAVSVSQAKRAKAFARFFQKAAAFFDLKSIGYHDG
jgi:hypothetical protein